VSDERRVLDWLIESFENTLEEPEIHFVGGYRMEDVFEEYPAIHFSRNEDWERTGTLGSLLSSPFDDTFPLFICYSDIVFRSDVVADLVEVDAEVAVAVDEGWATRYRSRSRESLERAEKVVYKNNLVDEISTDIDPEFADAEFIGLAYVSPSAIGLLSDLIDRGVLDAEDDLPNLINALRLGGLEPVTVDVDMHWAELETAEDLTQFVLDTKANTLKRLESMVTKSTIAPQFTFTAEEFEVDPDQIVALIRERFNQNVIVRSSTLTEDGWHQSNAGRFESILDIPSDDKSALIDAIERVIDSYDGNPSNQVLVQPMVGSVAASGVIMTRTIEHSGPYYVINYDASSESTVTVTDGSGDSIQTVVVRRDVVETVATRSATSLTLSNASIDASAGSSDSLSKTIGSTVRSIGDPALRLPAVLRAITELEAIIGHDGLDVEFAVTDSGEVYVLQVRPMTVDPGERLANDSEVVRSVEGAREAFRESQYNSPIVFGNRTIFGVMPDWNPAEIIGRTPRRLAVSLYRYLIMDEVWARQRAEFGYRDVRPLSLMHSFAGQPFVDLRADFNSFIPSSVSDEVATRLVEYYLDRLEANPELHDKIEFEIALTCLPFDFHQRAEPLLEAGFSRSELEELRDGLRTITHNAFERVESGDDLDALDILEGRYVRIRDAELPDLEAVRLLLEDCRRYGTLPFAHLARAAFVAMSLLRSLERKGVLEESDVSRFLNSLSTVAHEFECDGYRVAVGELTFEQFVHMYGHLRPGTYDITSSSYANDPEGYLRPIVEAAESPENQPDLKAVWNVEAKSAIESELRRIGLPADCDRFIDFLAAAIEGREHAKFVFTKNLSEALERIVSFGEAHGFTRDELSHIPITDFLELTTDQPAAELGPWLQDRVTEGARRHTVAQTVELPPLLCDETDFLAFERPASEPNFVTNETVRAELAEPASDDDPHIDGRIVMIPQADPGFDWLLGYDIAGLVTMYGGENSHMAIRAAEFGLPAAIGIGESLYEQLTGADVIELDCSTGTVEVVR
jgi:choline kinase